MFGSTALSIVTGLILIYLLYSLLATIIGEIIATFLGLRARNLERAIKIMLDGDAKSDADNKVVAFFESLFKLVKSFFFRNRKGMVKKVYDEPVIKLLSSNRFFSKPSYISPQNFSKALIDILKREGHGTADIEKVKNALKANGPKENRDAALHKILNSGDPEDEKVKKIASVFKAPFGEDAKNHILSLLEDAKNDLEEFKVRLEQWFDEVMEQSTGWYKRNMQVVLLLTGFCLASLFNASTFDIVKKLSKDKVAREQLVQMASSYVEENDTLIAYITKVGADTLIKTGDEIKLKLDTLLDIKKSLEKDIDDTNSLLANGWNIPDSLFFTPLNAKRDSSISKYQLIDPTNSIVIYFPENLDFNLAKKCFKVKLDEGENAKPRVVSVNFRPIPYFLRQVWKNFWGYFVTALAISLGAPFWFDLLSKLVKIRSEVQKIPKRGVGN